MRTKSLEKSIRKWNEERGRWDWYRTPQAGEALMIMYRELGTWGKVAELLESNPGTLSAHVMKLRRAHLIVEGELPPIDKDSMITHGEMTELVQVGRCPQCRRVMREDAFKRYRKQQGIEYSCKNCGCKLTVLYSFHSWGVTKWGNATRNTI